MINLIKEIFLDFKTGLTSSERYYADQFNMTYIKYKEEKEKIIYSSNKHFTRATVSTPYIKRPQYSLNVEVLEEISTAPVKEEGMPYTYSEISYSSYIMEQMDREDIFIEEKKYGPPSVVASSLRGSSADPN